MRKIIMIKSNQFISVLLSMVFVLGAAGLLMFAAPTWAAPTEKFTICHRDAEFDPGKTLALKEHKAVQHIGTHVFDTEGECPAPPPGSDRPAIEIMLNRSALIW